MISIFDLLFICLSKIRGPRVSPLCLSVHALDNGPTAGNIQLPTVFIMYAITHFVYASCWLLPCTFWQRNADIFEFLISANAHSTDSSTW